MLGWTVIYNDGEDVSSFTMMAPHDTEGAWNVATEKLHAKYGKVRPTTLYAIIKGMNPACTKNPQSRQLTSKSKS
jgi:hypothetical protein